MSRQPFHRLAPFIQEYIYRSGWSALRDVQVEAFDALFDTSRHVLIASGTASGKTEAAFFPMLTMLEESPAASIGILYISPLKALINDQFLRLQELLEEARLPVYAWHGDRSQSEKQRVLRRPAGVLQITPESLEAMLMQRPGDAARLFSDLRFILIDEVHAFMGQDRGLQLLCQLARLARLTGRAPRRVGLSATLYDYGAAAAWLAADTGVPVQVVTSQSDGKRLELSIAYFTLPDQRAALHEHLYRLVEGRKCLIFTNSRTDAEDSIAELRQIAEKKGDPDIFHVHHGSISAALRSEAEFSLRNADGPAVAAATRTLELGIDLGGLERVVQLGAPFSCSSFVQRLGRAGRREGDTARMSFIARETVEDEMEDAQDSGLLPWELLQNIAVIQLYLEERWVETPTPKPCPYSLLFQQTLSALTQHGELSPRELAGAVLTLPPFQGIDQAIYRDLLLYWIRESLIERTEEGGLIVGLAGERLTGQFRFYTVFRDEERYTVLTKEQTIGEIEAPPAEGDVLTLSGRFWQVLEIDPARKLVFVEPSHVRKRSVWNGRGGDVDGRVVERMRLALAEDADYAYLQPSARHRLAQARAYARRSGIASRRYTPAGKTAVLLHPWVGAKVTRTLRALLGGALKKPLGIYAVHMHSPYSLLVQTDQAPAAFIRSLEAAAARITPGHAMPAHAPETDAYDAYLPAGLRGQAYVENTLDVEGARQIRWSKRY